VPERSRGRRLPPALDAPARRSGVGSAGSGLLVIRALVPDQQDQIVPVAVLLAVVFVAGSVDWLVTRSRLLEERRQEVRATARELDGEREKDRARLRALSKGKRRRR